MKEIKLTFGRGGKVRMKANKSSAVEMSAFTEKLAKNLGNIEERHVGGQHQGNFTQENQGEQQKAEN